MMCAPCVGCVYIIIPSQHSLNHLYKNSLPEYFNHSNLRLLKNYQGICLLYVASKVISVIIADRCQSVLKQHGIYEKNSILKK